MLDEMPHRDHFSWGSILIAYYQANLPQKTLAIFPAMFTLDKLQPNHIVFASLVKACACLGATRQGRQVHARFVISPFCDNDFVKSSLVDTNAKCGLSGDAHPVFDSIKFKDSVSWNAMLSVYARSGRRNEALEMFETVPDRNLSLLELGKQIHGIVIAFGYESSLFISNALVDMYAKCSDIVAAKNIFGRMRRKDVVSWTSIIVGEAQHGRAEEALAIYDAMVSAGVKPSEVTFVGLTYACSHVGLVSRGRKLFKSMTDDYGISPSLKHYKCFVDLRSRSGHLAEAENVIKAMPFKPNKHTWKFLLSACKQHGNTQMGIRVPNQLLSLKSDDPATYIFLSDVYASAAMWEHVLKVRKLMALVEVKKEMGCSRIDIGKESQVFHAGKP
ncbi:hypothetical protein Patl1_26989 [Pistacia atlantica]|uniref:Uncharacterized protein n=1 Tax=Pistacia atlantica TaxID=434234 RepID=A0ACC1B4D1_9ROSI|nr:hypothetical protein Patl1_26989 [Pistacia atlantica]